MNDPTFRDQIRAHFSDAAPNHGRRHFMLARDRFVKLAEMSDFVAAVADRRSEQADRLVAIGRRVVARYREVGALDDFETQDLIDRLEAAIGATESGA